MKPLTLISSLGLTAFTVGAVPLAYEPFDYPAGELLCPAASTPQRTDTDGRYWISGTSQTTASDAAIVSGSISYPGLATSAGGSMTNGSGASQQSNRYVFGPGTNAGTVYVSFLMRVDSLGASFQGAPNQQGIITAMGYYNNLTPPTFIQAGLMWIGTNGVDLASFRLGAKKLAATPYSLVQWATNGLGNPIDFPVGQILMVVQAYTFNPGSSGDDDFQIWVNPDSSTFGAAIAPPSSATALIDGSDLAYIDRFNFRQTTTVQTPEAATFDELRIGTDWADVTPPLAVEIPRPKLNIASASPTTALLSWPTNPPNYFLAGSTNVTDATTNWPSVTNVVSVNGTNNNVTVDLNVPTRFFLLVRTNSP